MHDNIDQHDLDLSGNRLMRLIQSLFDNLELVIIKLIIFVLVGRISLKLIPYEARHVANVVLILMLEAVFIKNELWLIISCISYCYYCNLSIYAKRNIYPQQNSF